jgi:hypothetical protein
LLHLRISGKALPYGNYERPGISDGRILFTRYYEGKKVTVTIKFGLEIKFELPGDAIVLRGKDLFKTNAFLIHRNQV